MTKELKIPSIRRKYKDEWVAVAVTRRDKSLVPMAGKVLIHDPDREKVYDHGFEVHKKIQAWSYIFSSPAILFLKVWG